MKKSEIKPIIKAIIQEVLGDRKNVVLPTETPTDNYETFAKKLQGTGYLIPSREDVAQEISKFPSSTKGKSWNDLAKRWLDMYADFAEYGTNEVKTDEPVEEPNSPVQKHRIYLKLEKKPDPLTTGGAYPRTPYAGAAGFRVYNVEKGAEPNSYDIWIKHKGQDLKYVWRLSNPRPGMWLSLGQWQGRPIHPKDAYMLFKGKSHPLSDRFQK